MRSTTELPRHEEQSRPLQPRPVPVEATRRWHLPTRWPLWLAVIAAVVAVQQANLSSIEAQRDALRQQVRLEVERAQLSATNAVVQRVQATYNLATARTELARALGRQVGPTG